MIEMIIGILMKILIETAEVVEVVEDNKDNDRSYRSFNMDGNIGFDGSFNDSF